MYRESAAETTPKALDDAVLREAREAAADVSWLRYPKTIHWLRPMAWAATIGLSFAIVLELTLSPTMTPDMATDANMAIDAEPFAATPAASPAAPAARQAEPLQETEQLEEIVVTGNPIRTEETPAEDMAEDMAADMAADMDGMRKAASDDAPSLASDVEVKRELERMNEYREQVETFTFADQPVAADAVPAMQRSAAYAIAFPCDEDDTEAPESWLECIERLDEQGRYVEAQRERERLTEAFPEFELPAPAN